MESTDTTTLNIITLNCQGLRASSDRDVLFSWLNCCSVDIVCLQETHSISEREFSSWLSFAAAEGRNKHNFKCLSSPGTTRSSGVAILYKPDFTLDCQSRDVIGRVITADFSFHNYAFKVCNIYAPNTSKEGSSFFESLHSLIDISTPTVLCGDFNTVPHAVNDRLGCNPLSPWAYNWSPALTCLMDTYDLHDVWRLHHPGVQEYTWRRPNGLQASRLDMFWISSFLLAFVGQVSITPFFRSDHSCVFLELRFPTSIHRGRGVWKFNVTHLQDPSFIALIRDFWCSWQLQKSSFFSLASWWDAGKARLRRQMQAFSRAKASSSNRALKSLERTLYHLQRRFDKGEDVSSLIQATKTDLEEAHRLRVQGARIRAQTQWVEEGESSTSYFFRLERNKGQQRLIHSIRTLSGAIVSSWRAIVSAWMQFYVLLYTSQPLDLVAQQFFLGHLHLKLSQPEQDLCEGLLTTAECKAAVDAMATGKSPGIDGIPAEFYRVFWDLLGADLVDVLNYCYTTGCLSASQRSGVITLLHKKGDRQEMKNWRPITLLCVDYKIAAKAMANRLLSVLDKVIHPDQACGVPGRNVSETTRLLKDIVHHANSLNRGGAIISLDQEKAFDRVDWSYLGQVLKAMNFGPSFCAWVSLFYSHINSRVLVNGDLSDPFSVSRGVRQGCPLSPLLYVMVAETIAAAIRFDRSISGYTLPDGNSLKLCQYADDTSVVVTSDQGIHSLFHLFAQYGQASGAKLNITKSHGLLFGSWKSRQTHVVPLGWSNHKITVLGSSLSPSGEEDWDPHLHAITSLCALWSKRALSFHGRALLVNSLALSKLWYLLSHAQIPPDVVKSINKVIYAFVWSKKREWLARSSVTQKSCHGGLGVVDITRKASSLHFLWVKRLLLHSTLPWTTFFRQYLTRAFPGRTVHQILLLRHPPKYALDALPPFYRSVMTAWFSLPRSFEGGNYIVYRSTHSFVVLNEVSAQFVYAALSSAQRTQHRCVEKYRGWGLQVDWRTVWLNLHLWRFVRPARDTSWLIAHGILPTADRLLALGMPVDPLCDCGQRETLIHLFFDCPFATHALTWYSALLRRFTISSPALTAAEALLGFGPSTKLPPIFSCLLGLIRHQLWVSRNRARFDHRPRHSDGILRRITSSAKFLVRIQQRHCPPDRFSTLWLAGGTIGTLSQAGIIFSDDFG